MTVLTSKLRTSIRRVVQGRGLTFRQLLCLYRTLLSKEYLGPGHCIRTTANEVISLWPDYQREQYIRELLR